MGDATVAKPVGRHAAVAGVEKRPAAPTTRIGVGDFLAVAVQLGLVLGVAIVYRIELERGFATVAALTFLGFLVHTWLPMRWRMPFFVLLTMTAIGLLLRADGIWLVALGLGLLGLCHLPIAWAGRVALVLAMGACLAALQTGWFELAWAGAVLPVLGAMFMFRLVVYLYDLKTERTPADPWQRIAYFFLLPNVCFPLFPVVDYKTFLRTYYDAPAAEIYQKAVYWMLRGISHLLLYRLVYYLLPRAEADLHGVVGVYIFMAMTYGLYLRISGLFHLIVGSLCLFGFNLPPTNHHYFLASSFSDLWRRINIYWKDFMMTVVFYPVFMEVRRWSMSARLVFATTIVFFITWFLHSYQWFWLRGVFPVTGTDIAFWGLLGVALAGNSVWEARRGRRRRVGLGSEWSWKEALSVTARTIGVFSTMAILWSLWDSGSFAEWGYRLLRVRESTPLDWSLFALLLSGTLLVGVGAHWLAGHGWGLGRVERLAGSRASLIVPTASLALLVVGLPFVHVRVGGPVERVVSKAQSNKPNSIDSQRQERGYYETLSRSTQLGPIPDQEREDLLDDREGFQDSPAVRPTRDLRGWEIVPGVEVVFKGSTLRANRWGLRDRDYEMAKPPGTYRLALIGFSHEMGAGVENEETFENVLEDRLNRELARHGYEHYEFLNFSVGGYGRLQAMYVAEHRVPRFEPDAVICVIHPGEAERLVDRLGMALAGGTKLGEEYAYITQVLEIAGAHPGLPPREFTRRLQPYRDQLLLWAYKRGVAATRAHGAASVFVFLPVTDAGFRPGELKKLTRFAREAGAIVVTLPDVYDGYELERIRIAEWDNHPNALGHRLIADKLYAALLEKSDTLGLLPESRVEATPR